MPGKTLCSNPIAWISRLPAKKCLVQRVRTDLKPVDYARGPPTFIDFHTLASPTTKPIVIYGELLASLVGPTVSFGAVQAPRGRPSR
jgi:hypothetical protein